MMFSHWRFNQYFTFRSQAFCIDVQPMKKEQFHPFLLEQDKLVFLFDRNKAPPFLQSAKTRTLHEVVYALIYNHINDEM